VKIPTLVALTLALFGALNARNTPKLVPFLAQGKWGYSTFDGNLKIPAKYDSVSVSSLSFNKKHPSVRFVRDGQRMALIDDSTGKEIPLGDWNQIEHFPYVNIYPGNTDPNVLVFRVMKNGKYGIISNTGIRIPAKYDTIESHDIVVKGGPGARPMLYPLLIGFKKGKPYTFDRHGKEKPYKGVIKKDNDNYAVMSTSSKAANSNPRVANQQSELESYGSGSGNVIFEYRENGKIGLKRTSKNGDPTAITNPIFDKTSCVRYEDPFRTKPQYFIVTASQKRGLIDASGKELLETKYDKIDVEGKNAIYSSDSAKGILILNKNLNIDLSEFTQIEHIQWVPRLFIVRSSTGFHYVNDEGRHYVQK